MNAQCFRPAIAVGMAALLLNLREPVRGRPDCRIDLGLPLPHARGRARGCSRRAVLESLVGGDELATDEVEELVSNVLFQSLTGKPTHGGATERLASYAIGAAIAPAALAATALGAATKRCAPMTAIARPR